MFVLWFLISEYPDKIALLADHSKYNDLVEHELQQEHFNVLAQDGSIPQDLSKLSHFGTMRMLHSLPTGQ